MNELVNRIASGDATLLGVEEICKRLGVSRSTFERWVRNGASAASVLKGPLASSSLAAGLRSGWGGLGSDTESSLSFPPPDIRIGNSPKWELETFKSWLTKNVTSGSR